MDYWEEEQVIMDVQQPAIPPAIQEASQPFVGRWHRLVSQTNWEKGQIICQWRRSLQESGAPASTYSDEAWSRLVGGVSPQHVGRLRRVYERFGQIADQFPGLYWSHFLAALDWPDAEMWLEGAMQNRWTVAQMQAQRTQTLGLASASRTGLTLDAQIDEESAASWQMPPAVLVPEQEQIRLAGQESAKSPLTEQLAEDSLPAQEDAEASSSDPKSSQPAEPPAAFADLPPMPDDVAEAFEAFKLAIVRHKLAGWQEISCRQILKILDALKRFAQSHNP